MSANFICQAFGLQCHDYGRQDFAAGNILLPCARGSVRFVYVRG